ncbi:MAG: CHASE3 domain-containing protein [Pseudomonadota bacterium]
MGLVVLIGALIGIGALSTTAYRQAVGTETARNTAGALYAESYQTIMAAEAVYDAIQDAERGERGFALTQNPVFLDPYRENISLVEPRLVALEALSARNDIQRGRIASLRRISRLKLQEMAEIVDLVETGQAETARRNISSGFGRRLMNEIRDIMTELRAEEQRVLEERRTALAASANEARRSIEQLAMFGIAMLAVAFLTTLVLGVALARTDRAARRERVVEEENEALEAAVATRTRELVAANDSLRAEAAARGTAEDRLRQSQRMEAIGQLTGGIAHDFNNMLAVVIGSLDLLRRRTKDDTKRLRLIDNALDGANRAATLTSRLLSFSRQQSLKPVVADLNTLISGLDEFLKRTLGETIHISTQLDDDVPPVFVDEAELENVIINLAANARDAMPRGGMLTITTSARTLKAPEERLGQRLEAGRYAFLSIADTGAGMSKDILEKVYEPFFTTKPVGRGTGLGLSQVHGFMLQSGGSIDIRSTPGEGTTIELMLPEGRPVEDMVEEREEPQGDVPRATSGETVLVVEDQGELRSLTVDVLRDLGYVVRHAGDVAAAMIALDSMPRIDLLFTDIVMPDRSGDELAREARIQRPDLRILYSSGYTQAAGVDAATLDPQAPFLRKPYKLDDLARAIRDAIDGEIQSNPVADVQEVSTA